MEPVEYVFRIDAFTPDTLPMARLAEYLAALAKLIGHSEHTHFVRIEEGSAQLLHKVDAVDAPKVETRLNSIRVGDAPKDAAAAKDQLEDLLANDNAKGTLTEVATGRVVIPFVGRDRQKPIAFPPFREQTSIVGQVVNIGGRDATAHATLQDGDTFHVNVSMKREIAKKLAPLLYGPPVRLFGTGRFERKAAGAWKMHEFKVDAYEVLNDRPVSEVLEGLRSIPGNRLMAPEAARRLGDERDEGGDEQ